MLHFGLESIKGLMYFCQPYGHCCLKKGLVYLLWLVLLVSGKEDEMFAIVVCSLVH